MRFVLISSLLVARLSDGEWSAPLAVGALGMSWGLQIGASLADVVVVIMRPSALEPFKQPEALDMHLGPESGFAVGPVGRAAGVSHGVDVFDEAPPPLPSLDQLSDELQAGDVGPAVARGKQLEADAKVSSP